MNLDNLLTENSTTDLYFNRYVSKSIDKRLTIRNWLIGAYILEFEQNRDVKAEYSSKMEQKLALKINLKGFLERNLKLFKKFHISCP